MKFSKYALSTLSSTALGFLALGLTPAAAFATTATTTFTVNATVVATCVVGTTTNMAFGNYTGAQFDTTATLSAQCSNNASYTVGLDKGTSVGASQAARFMTGAAGVFLNYTLYTDAARGTPWAAQTQTFTGNGNAQVVTVYGRVAGSQFVAAGSYNDLVTATFTF